MKGRNARLQERNSDSAPINDSGSESEGTGGSDGDRSIVVV